MKTAITPSSETDIVLSPKEVQAKRKEVVVLRIYPDAETEPTAWEPLTPPSFSAAPSALPNDDSLDSFNSSSSGPASVVEDKTDDLLACGLLLDELAELELLEAKYSSTATCVVHHKDAEEDEEECAVEEEANFVFVSKKKEKL